MGAKENAFPFTAARLSPRDATTQLGQARDDGRERREQGVFSEPGIHVFLIPKTSLPPLCTKRLQSK